MTAVKKVDIKSSALTLAELLKKNPAKISKEDFQKGNEFIALYENNDFNLYSMNVDKLIVDALLMAIQDLSTGGEDLRSGRIGVQFHKNKYSTFLSSHENQADGTVIFSIYIKTLAAFQAWRKHEHDEIDQDLLQYGTYRLIVALSQRAHLRGAK